MAFMACEQECLKTSVKCCVFEEEEVQQDEERLLQSSLTLCLPTVTIVDTSVKSLLSCPLPCHRAQA